MPTALRPHAGESLRAYGQELKTCLDVTERCRSRHVKPGVSGIFDRVGRSFDTSDAEQKADSVASALASTVMETNGRSAEYPAPVNELLRRNSEIQVKQQELESELSKDREKKAALESQQAAEQQERSRHQAERSRTESRYWGLSGIK